MEVDKGHIAAALHHPVRGDRRVESARQQGDDPARGSGRQAPKCASLVEVIERLVCQQLDMDDQLGGAQVHLPAARLLDPPADLALDLRRGEREPLVRAACQHPEAAALPVAEVADDGRGDRLDLERRPLRVGVVGDPEGAPDPLAHHFPVRAGAELELDAAHQDPDGRHVQIGHGAPQVAHESRDEPGTVLSLEGQLLVVNDKR